MLHTSRTSQGVVDNPLVVEPRTRGLRREECGLRMSAAAAHHAPPKGIPVERRTPLLCGPPRPPNPRRAGGPANPWGAQGG